MRLIIVPTAEKAAALRSQILSGASFETREGFLGVFNPSDLRSEFQAGLSGLKPGEVSPVIQIGKEYALLQFVTADELNRGQEVRDNFTAVLSLAYFRDKQFDDAYKKFADAAAGASLTEELYIAMSSILSGAELTAEADALMARAVREFPDSRRVRYRSAELHRDAGRMRKALEVFQEASTMKAPPDMDPALDRRQRSFIYQRMGGINNDLVRFDDAAEAYRRALEIDPLNAEARLALGDLYLRRDKLDDALKEFTRVLSERPDSAAVHNRIAELHLRMGKFLESAESAAKALAIDPAHRRSSYVRAMALMRTGQNQEGEKQLRQYEELEAGAQSDLNAFRQIVAVNRGAAALLLDGRAEEAIATFRKGIEAHPKAGSIRLNLALAQSKLGRLQDAAKSFQEILDLGLSDSFVIHFNLARLYEKLGDARSRERHQLLYVQSLDAALEAGLN